MHRFFLPIEAKQKDQIIITAPDLIKQIIFVLRLKTDDKIIGLFNDGQEYEVVLVNLHKKNIIGQIINVKPNHQELDFDLILCQALPKSKEKWEFILQKATELGVKNIIPLITQHSLAKYPYTSERIDKIIKEASEQSNRGILPQILPAINLRPLNNQLLNHQDLLNYFSGNQKDQNNVFFIADLHTKDSLNLLNHIEKIKINLPCIKRVGIFIGPEGDFTIEEINLFKSWGGYSANLGQRILRLETATIMALGILSLWK